MLSLFLFRFRWAPFLLPAVPSCASSSEVSVSLTRDAPPLVPSLTSNSLTTQATTSVQHPIGNRDGLLPIGHSEPLAEHLLDINASNSSPTHPSSPVVSSNFCFPLLESPDSRNTSIMIPATEEEFVDDINKNFPTGSTLAVIDYKPESNIATGSIEAMMVTETEPNIATGSIQTIIDQKPVPNEYSVLECMDVDTETSNIYEEIDKDEFARYEDLQTSPSAKATSSHHTIQKLVAESNSFIPKRSEIEPTNEETEDISDGVFASVDDILMEEEISVETHSNFGSPLSDQSLLARSDLSYLEYMQTGYSVKSPDAQSPHHNYLSSEGQEYFLNQDCYENISVEEMVNELVSTPPPRPDLPSDDADDEHDSTPPRPVPPFSFDSTRLSRRPSLPTIPEDGPAPVFTSPSPLLSQTIIFTSSSLRPDESTQQNMLNQTIQEGDYSQEMNPGTDENMSHLEQNPKQDDVESMDTSHASQRKYFPSNYILTIMGLT